MFCDVLVASCTHALDLDVSVEVGLNHGAVLLAEVALARRAEVSALTVRHADFAVHPAAGVAQTSVDFRVALGVIAGRLMRVPDEPPLAVLSTIRPTHVVDGTLRGMEVVASIGTRLGPRFWPSIKDGFQRLGSVGLMVCGPGLHAKLIEAGVRADRIVCDQERQDRDMLLTDQPMSQAVRVLVGFDGRLSTMKRGSRQPRCDLVGAADFGMDWRTWIRQFPVVGKVKGRARRRLASERIPLPAVHVGKPVPISDGFTSL